MNRKHLILFAISLIFLAGCVSAPVKDITFNSQADPKANLSGYQTFTWLGSASIVNDAEGQWEPPGFDADAEIKHLIDRELRKRGMSENKNEPDLLVVFAAGVDMEALELKEDPETEMDMLVTVPQGGLLIGFLDSETGFVVWLGVATGEVQDDVDEQTVKARLDYAVTRLFSEIPK
jgi:hypothetical protein